MLIEHPTVRSIQRMDMPSQSRGRIWVRVASGSLFFSAHDMNFFAYRQ